MKLLFEPYPDALDHWPTSGQHILAHQQQNQLVVYQAFKPSIARFAIENQRFGGPDYKMGRMTWIKPNFLWMMYRAGWAQKKDQERILALWMEVSHFETLLSEAVHSSYKAGVYADHTHWKEAVAASDVRLQWDPDHDPYGAKQERRAIQLGIRGEMLRYFHTHLTRIEDITDFVDAQHLHVKARNLRALTVPVERVYRPQKEQLFSSLQLDPTP